MTRRHGHVKISRKLFTDGSELWTEERRFSRFEAWLDLIQLTAFAGTEVVANGHLVVVPRGHFLASIRHLMDRWRWPRMTVSRFLNTLEGWDTIRAANGTALGTLYLVVNYESYQGARDSKWAENGTANGTIIRQVVKTREETEEIESAGAREVSAGTEARIAGAILPASASYLHTLCRLANESITARYGEQTQPIFANGAAARTAADAMEAAGVPVGVAGELILGHVLECAAAGRPAPFSLGYFTRRVISAWAAKQAGDAPPMRMVANGKPAPQVFRYDTTGNDDAMARLRANHPEPGNPDAI